MKRNFRSNGEDDGGLDSLLDTMTNVVGILVLVLIVTQLSVAEVVSRLTAEVQVDAADVVAIQRQLVAKRREAWELERMLVDPLNIDAEAQREQLERNQELLQRRKKQLEQTRQQHNEFAIKLERDRQQADQASQRIEETKKQREETERRISASLEQIATLKAKLEETPRRQPPEDVEVSIPDPRPAPPGAVPVILVCADNLLYPVNLEFFRETAKTQAQTIIARSGLDQNPAAGVDPDRFTQVWERLQAKDDFFDVEYFVENATWPSLRFLPRSGRGAGEAELVNPRSRIRTQWLGNLNANRQYARFMVLSDSFDVYLTARRLFSDAGMLAGWEPQASNWTYTTRIGGGIRLGPPPPPPPPKPDNGTEPKPPPKPPAVID